MKTLGINPKDSNKREENRTP